MPLAAGNEWMDPTIAAGIAWVRGVRRLGIRVGKWATAEEATALQAWLLAAGIAEG